MSDVTIKPCFVVSSSADLHSNELATVGSHFVFDLFNNLTWYSLYQFIIIGCDDRQDGKRKDWRLPLDGARVIQNG